MAEFSLFELIKFLYFNTKGRIGRTSFFLSAILLVIISTLVSSFLLVFFDYTVYQVMLVYYIALFAPFFAIYIKRLQDMGISPKIFLILYLLMPLIYALSLNIWLIYLTATIQGFIFIILCLAKGNKQENKYAKNPKYTLTFQDINYEIFKYIVISLTITLSAFYVYKDIIYDKHIRPQVKIVLQNKAVFMQLNALSEWAKVVKTDKFKNLSEQEQDAARLSFARYINNRIKQMNIYTDEQLEKDFDKLIVLMKDVEKKSLKK